MPMYVRHTRSVRHQDLPARIRDKLVTHAESRQLDLSNVRAWITHSENPPASSGLGKLLRRRANSADPDAEHWTVLVLHPTHIIVVNDGAKRGTAALSVPLTQASMTSGSAIGARLGADDRDGFSITGFATGFGTGGQQGSYYIGLGPEGDAADCMAAVRSAITEAKNPP